MFLLLVYRKLILSKQKLPLEAFTEELRLSRLILSNSPKSEPTWSHRSVFYERTRNLSIRISVAHNILIVIVTEGG